MNILEAEDMVKGLPDQVLFQYAQNPPPQIPQFLAISEVQRRQDMRQRFQARQGGNEPTIKDQILQGGIASAGGPPPGGGEPPPMAPPDAAPPGAPMQQPMTGAPMPPMGMAEGGAVQGGTGVFYGGFTPSILNRPDQLQRRYGASENPGVTDFVQRDFLGNPIKFPFLKTLKAAITNPESLITPEAIVAASISGANPGLRAPPVSGGGGGGLPYGGPTSYGGSSGYGRNELMNMISQFGDRRRPTVTVEEIPAQGTVTVEEIPQGMSVGGIVPYNMNVGGLTPGGIVRMQQGRTVPRNEFEYLNNLRSQAIRAGDLAAVERIEKSIQAALDQNRSVARERMIGNLLPDFSGILPDQSLTERFKLDVPSRPSSSAAPQQPDVQRILAKPPYSRTAQENDLLRASGVQLERSVIPREGITVPYSDVIKRVIDPSGLTSFTGQILPESDRARIERRSAEQFATPTPPRPRLGTEATTSQVLFPNAAPAANLSNIPPGGVADAGAALAGQRTDGQRTAPPAAGSQSALSFQSLLNGLISNERPAEVQAAIDLQRQQMEQGLPPPVDISQFIQSAQQRQKEAKDEARRMAIAGTLMNLGAGVMGGDPAAGLRQATQTAMSTLAEGRREASAEGRMAEQLQLQAAQQQRQSILDTMKFKSDAVNNIANIVSGEQKATRSDKLQAAQLIATYQANREKIIADERVQLGRNANSAQAARSAALKIAGDYIAANPALTIKKDGQRFTPEEVSKLTRDFAMSLDPEAFGSASSSGGSSNQEVTFAEIRSRNQR